MNDLGQQLRERLRGRVCLVGVGNADHGDDGFGVRLAESLEKRCQHGIEVVVGGQTPERCLSRLAQAGFDHVVFLDAVEFGGTAGSVVFLNSAEMAARLPQVSTHKLSLGLLARLIEAGGRTRAWLLGVQPGSLAQGTGLTTAVQSSLGLLADLLAESVFEKAPRRGREEFVVPASAGQTPEQTTRLGTSIASPAEAGTTNANCQTGFEALRGISSGAPLQEEAPC